MHHADASPVRSAAWRCPVCQRIFRRARQPHSCRSVDLEDHFRRNKALRPLFGRLLDALHAQVGTCEVVSLPCCIHLFGTHDFAAVLPKKDRLEVRFALGRELKDPKVTRSAQIGRTAYKHSVDVAADGEIDETLLGWLREAYDAR
jgi:hypothetical protein